MDYTCRDTIIRNMLDFGCDEQVIDAFLKYFDYGNKAGQKKILKNYRRYLLDQLHMNQKNIDLLDFMVYQLEKCNCNDL